MIFLLAGCLHPQVAPTVAPSTPLRPKNVILFIGDGMGPQQIGLLQLYARRAPGSKIQTTSFDRLGQQGSMALSMHDPAHYLITDSACSATQLALGQSAPVEAVGVDADGHPQPTVLERAQERGLAVGLVSDTRITHATPASFASHVGFRGNENSIAEQLLEQKPDVLLSGCLLYTSDAADE